ncbi:YbaK/EbsC family protein [uncultured Pseudokineococcus sp.]|uniref:YbaK/EbsC family protein n=1 Tax=uncultured Pseudokineococcus sp. TaxID=1642928 RepID=UPI0034451B9C
MVADGAAHVLRPFERVAHAPAEAGYGQEAAAALGVDPARVLKTLVAEVDGSPLLAVVPVAGRLDLRALAAARGGRRAALCEPAAAQRLTGGVVGAISPLGLRRPLPVVVDASAAAHPTVLVSAGRRGLDVELAPADLVRLAGATYAPVGRPATS